MMTLDDAKERIDRLEAEIEESRQDVAELRVALAAVLNVSEAALKSNSRGMADFRDKKKSWFSSELVAAALECARKPK